MAPSLSFIKKLLTKIQRKNQDKWKQLREKLHQLRQGWRKNPWPSLEEMRLTPLEASKSSSHSGRTMTATQWALDEHTADNKNVTIVEVEFFPKDPYQIQPKDPALSLHLGNYTAKGEDPNLRITHYPPSNRLH